MAILGILGDESRSDIRMLTSRLASMEEAEVEQLLDSVLDVRRTGDLLASSDELLRLLAREVAAGDFDQYVKMFETYSKEGIRVVPYWDATFPQRLRNIPSPPLLLYVRGSTFPPSRPVAVVGSRRASEAGRLMARTFAFSLGKEGFTIVSGLAWGCDTAAHIGALDAGGVTIAVLAGHVDHIHPRFNYQLAQRIKGRGALVSELTHLGGIHKGRFVERNRITSGMSLAVIISECAREGGTIHQARFALSQDRPTFVVDHGDSMTSEARRGYEALVKLGATPVNEPQDVVSALDEA